MIEEAGAGAGAAEGGGGGGADVLWFTKMAGIL